MHGNLITFVTNFLISHKLKSNLKINFFFFSEEWLCYNGWVTHQISERMDIYIIDLVLFGGPFWREKFKCQFPVVVYVIIATFCANATRICLHGTKTINLTVIYHLPHF